MNAPPRDRIVFFVPGKLSNPLNGSWGSWRKHWRIARDWRERTVQYAACALDWTPLARGSERTPKRVTFRAHTARPWDEDNIRAAVKPLRDGLMNARLIHDDSPTSGHLFVYEQVVDRTRRGVEITVEAG
jgi:hypothetical protein